MLTQKDIEAAFKLLMLDSEISRKKMLNIGSNQPKSDKKVIQCILLDNVTSTDIEKESKSAGLE